VKTATFVRNIDGWRGDARLYKLSEPVTFSSWDDEGKIVETQTSFVIVSAISCAFDTGRPETYIFPANEEGNPLNMEELDGSFRGDMDHKKALTDAGYTITTQEAA
jgi:hypothetical protein